MWWSVALSTASGVGGLYVIHAAYNYDETRRDKNNAMSGVLDHIHTIDDAIHLLQKIASRKPTEDVVEELEKRLIDNGITEEALLRLSKLHRQYANDDGIHGYAINQIWSMVLHTVQTKNVIIVC